MSFNRNELCYCVPRTVLLRRVRDFFFFVFFVSVNVFFTGDHALIDRKKKEKKRHFYKIFLVVPIIIGKNPGEKIPGTFYAKIWVKKVSIVFVFCSSV